MQISATIIVPSTSTQHERFVYPRSAKRLAINSREDYERKKRKIKRDGESQYCTYCSAQPTHLSPVPTREAPKEAVLHTTL